MLSVEAKLTLPIYTHIHSCIYQYIYTHVGIWIYTQICLHENTHQSIMIYIRKTNTHIHTYTHEGAQIYICVYIHDTNLVHVGVCMCTSGSKTEFYCQGAGDRHITYICIFILLGLCRCIHKLVIVYIHTPENMYVFVYIND